IYRLELDRIWRAGWVFAGHTCSIPEPGDYFTLEVDPDSIIVVHGEDRAIHALHNVCRHRGSLICDTQAGHATRFVCPYHQWTYRLDGSLVACRGMQDTLDKTQFGLRCVAAQEVEGLIFISLAEAPAAFAARCRP